MVYFSAFIIASFAATLSVSAHPLSARQDKPFSLENGMEAQQRKYVIARLPTRSGTNRISVVSTSRTLRQATRAAWARTRALTARSLCVTRANSQQLHAAAFSASPSPLSTNRGPLSLAPLSRRLQLALPPPVLLVVSLWIITSISSRAHPTVPQWRYPTVPQWPPLTAPQWPPPTLPRRLHLPHRPRSLQLHLYGSLSLSFLFKVSPFRTA
jgi:hypothetical protein